MEELGNATTCKQFLSPFPKKIVASIQFTMESFRFMGTQCPRSSISSLPGPVTCQEMLLTGHVILCWSWQWPYSRIPGNCIMIIPLELDIDSTECIFSWLWHLHTIRPGRSCHSNSRSLYVSPGIWSKALCLGVKFGTYRTQGGLTFFFLIGISICINLSFIFKGRFSYALNH